LVVSSVYENTNDYSAEISEASIFIYILNDVRDDLIDKDFTDPSNPVRFSALLMGKQKSGFSIVVRPSQEELNQADTGTKPIHLEGEVKYKGGSERAYLWDECYMFKKILPCPLKHLKPREELKSNP